MTKLYVSEFIGLAATDQSDSVDTVAVPGSGDQVVDYTSGHAESTAFKSTTKWVLLCADSICSLAFGAAPIATTSNLRFPANTQRIFRVNPGDKVSAITNT